MAPEPPPLSQARAPAPAGPRLVLIRGGRGPQESGADGRPVIVHVVATRPDAVKLAPVHAALAERGVFRQLIVHTGQHTDPALTTEIFDDLELPAPAHVLDTGAGSDGAQTARALASAETLLAELRPAALVVAGAANSTLGAVLAASKLGVPVARVEAGLRERDWSV